MARLEDLTAGTLVTGIVPGDEVTVVAVSWHGQEAVTLTYQETSGQVSQRLLFRADEPSIELGGPKRRWSFDGDGAAFRLAAEARRIRLAYLFDPMLAVHLSLLEPLPHQIRAVYGEMLPRQPLRFLLADDPGAGKTIMAGLFIKELLLRGDLRRCLIVVPGGLVAQWQDELSSKFSLQFSILTREAVEASLHGNPFAEEPLLIARMDQLSRSEELQSRLSSSEWDLIVVDEAHRMSAHYQGDEVRETQRYRLGKLLGGICRHFLLLTATPHSGKDEDFQLFLSLLDPDRFAGRGRGRAGDVSDLQRRMIKEKILRFDGRPLFPERRATTVPFPLSPLEMELYEEVTQYVREEMNRADRLEGGQRTVVGFALTGLQRRLASSPEAIYQSLRRRRERLEKRLAEGAEVSVSSLGRLSQLLSEEGGDDLEDLDPDEAERLDEEAVDQASAAQTKVELEAEIQSLARLEELAKQVRQMGTDSKWRELQGMLAEDRQLGGPGPRKLIIFTEYRATLDYLVSRLTSYFGRAEAVVAIHGGVHREERRRLQELFTLDPQVLVMVATDAAGEGINLQRAHLMVNYDLPWNPNRIEQRFGRIHRIGQTEVCHMWNLLAENTREGQVYEVLLNKLEEQRIALGGQVFDVLGQALPGRQLRELLIEAIRYGDRPDVRARLHQVVDAAVGEGLSELVDREALASDVMSVVDVQEVRLQMEEAAAQRLQPHFVRDFFLGALEQMGGRAAERERDRFELTFVPATIRNVPSRGPLLRQYERVTFEKDLITVPGKPLAAFICPGHPLLEAVIDLILDRDGGALTQGATLVDPTDDGREPKLLLFLEHKIADARHRDGLPPRAVSRRAQFVTLSPTGEPALAGPAPYLDYETPPAEQLSKLSQLQSATWLTAGVESAGQDYAISTLVPEHLAEVRQRTEARVRKVKAAVQARLTAEIIHWDKRATELQQQVSQGRQPRINPERARARADDLQHRLDRRLVELDQELKLRPLPPLVVGAALVVPAGLVAGVSGPPGSAPPRTRETKQVERRAVEAVLAIETRLRRNPVEMPPNNPGYDIRSIDSEQHLRLIEVKGRLQGSESVTVTRTEILTGLNSSRNYVLALVEVLPEGGERVRYLRDPFSGKSPRLHFAETSTSFDWTRLWEAAGDPS
ncbi:MAG: helicase-related protein [Candidatus Dormiibacterota bacterium]